MTTRPIVLQGTERFEPSRHGGDVEMRFDGSAGVWRTSDGRLAVRSADLPSTSKSATREGVDQSELVNFSTRITETREGIDQSERAN